MVRPAQLIPDNAAGIASEVYRARELKMLATSLVTASEVLLAQLEKSATPKPARLGGCIKLYDEVKRFEIELIRHALTITGGHQVRAANLLGVKPSTLHYKIKRYKLYAKGDEKYEPQDRSPSLEQSLVE